MSDVTPEGVLRLDVDFRIDVREMRDWPPACIAAFYEGIAQATSAVHAARQQLNANKNPRSGTSNE